MKTSIAILGQGFVGGSLTTVMNERGLDVFVYDKAGKIAIGGKTSHNDPKMRNIKHLVSYCENYVTVAKNFSNVYFVCVPTPMQEDGSADTSIVEGVLAELASLPGDRIAVVKSTVPPGSTKRWNERWNKDGLQIVFNPEFLREASALDDMRNQDRIILGGPKEAVNKVRDIFRKTFPDVPIHKTSSTNAEFVKYTINCMLAVKVSFANELFQICEKFELEDVDYDRIVELATLDKRLGDSHWKVPGPDGYKGYGGHCLVKDLNSLMFLANELDIDTKILNAVWKKNLDVRECRDWENMIGRAVSKKKDR